MGDCACRSVPPRLKEPRSAPPIRPRWYFASHGQTEEVAAQHLDDRVRHAVNRSRPDTLLKESHSSSTPEPAAMRPYLCLTLLAFALSVCCSGAAFAAPIQDSPPADSGPATKMHSPDPQQQARRLARKLQLTPEQETEITSILQKRAQQIAQLRGDSSHGDSSMDARAQRSQLRAIRQNSEQQLRGVLSDSQLQQYQQLRQQARQRHLERQAPGGSASSSP